ncbi:MAG: hypothetical protein ACI8Z1_001372 [Candidatus Azotimanducaceae bacterium]|jgi:uncharacterized protein (DUF1330 family)
MIVGIDIHISDLLIQYHKGAMLRLPELGSTVLSDANDIERLRGDWAPDRLVLLKF